jgi:hypothetical protein
MRLEQGTEVRVDIPDKADLDFERYHRRCGTIVAIVEGNASELTGDDCNDVRSRVDFDDCEQKDLLGETSDQPQSSRLGTRVFLS